MKFAKQILDHGNILRNQDGYSGGLCTDESYLTIFLETINIVTQVKHWMCFYSLLVLSIFTKVKITFRGNNSFGNKSTKRRHQQ